MDFSKGSVHGTFMSGLDDLGTARAVTAHVDDERARLWMDHYQHGVQVQEQFEDSQYSMYRFYGKRFHVEYQSIAYIHSEADK